MIFLFAACAPPAMIAAHSLDKGQVSGGFGGFGRASQVSGEFYSDDALEPVQPGLAITGLESPLDLAFDVRIGLGRGFELGTRGVPLVSATDLKFAVLDERREAVPLSLAIDLEGGLDEVWGIRPRVGLLASRTFAGNDRVAVRPCAGVWYGWGGFTYRAILPGEFSTDGDTPVATFRTRGQGFSVPAGIEVPVRSGEKLAMVPYVAWVSWWPTEWELLEADCESCVAGVGDLEPVHGAFLWAGVRFGPWLNPSGDGG